VTRAIFKAKYAEGIHRSFSTKFIVVLVTPTNSASLSFAFCPASLSALAYDLSLKFARTIANLAGEEEISLAPLSEAIQSRMMDRVY